MFLNYNQLKIRKNKQRLTILDVIILCNQHQFLKKQKIHIQKNIGVEHISQLNVIKDKKKLKQAIKNFKQLRKYAEYVLPNFTFIDYLKNQLNNQSWICVKCRKYI